MIKVTYKLENGCYTYLEVKGHALFAEYGKDLVCASVSSIVFGLMNCLDDYQDIDIKVLDNQIEINNYSKLDEINNFFKLALIQLKTIEESYGEYIKVERKWVWNIF